MESVATSQNGLKLVALLHQDICLQPAMKALLPFLDLPAHGQFLGGTLAFVWKDLKTSCRGDPPCPALACCNACSSPVLVDLVKSWGSQSPSL